MTCYNISQPTGAYIGAYIRVYIRQRKVWHRSDDTSHVPNNPETTEEVAQVDALPVNDLLTPKPNPYLNHQSLLAVAPCPPFLSQLEQETIDGVPIHDVDLPERIGRPGQSGHVDRDFLEYRRGY